MQTAEKPHVLQALLGRLLVEQAFFCFLIGHSKLAYPLAEEGVQIGEKLKIAAIAAGGYLSLNFLAEWRGDLDAKYKFATAGLAWAQVGQLAALENRCLGSIGMALLYKGEVTRSLPYLQSALRQAQALDAFLECQALGNLSLAHLCLGDFGAAQHYEAQALALSRRMEFVGLSAWAYLLAGERSMRLGQLDQAQSNLNQALAIYTSTGPRVLQCITYQRLSQLFLHRQDYAAALHAANEAVQIAQTYDIQFWYAVVLVSLGRAWLGLAHWLEAEAAFNVSLTIAQQTHNSDDMLMARAGLAAVQLAQHNLVSARQQVEGLWSLPSTFYQSPRTDPLFVWLTCYQVLATSGDPRAGERLQTAYRLLMEQAAILEDHALRQAFLENIAIHRELNALAQAAGITAYLDQLPKPLPPVSKNGFGSAPSGWAR